MRTFATPPLILATAHGLVNRNRVRLDVESAPNPLDESTLDELRASVGGDESFLAELVGEFLEDAPRQLETLRSGLEGGDAETVRRAAHTLKGNGRTFGAEELASVSQELEAAAKAGDLDAARARVPDLEAAWDRLRPALEEMSS
jgi:HPt (histidine-containing phosphotransfer) domain-containing protein